jgi:hypothetical protein
LALGLIKLALYDSSGLILSLWVNCLGESLYLGDYHLGERSEKVSKRGERGIVVSKIG